MSKKRLSEQEKQQAEYDYIARENARRPGVILKKVTVENETDESGKPVVRRDESKKA